MAKKKHERKAPADVKRHKARAPREYKGERRAMREPMPALDVTGWLPAFDDAPMPDDVDAPSNVYTLPENAATMSEDDVPAGLGERDAWRAQVALDRVAMSGEERARCREADCLRIGTHACGWKRENV